MQFRLIYQNNQLFSALLGEIERIQKSKYHLITRAKIVQRNLLIVVFFCGKESIFEWLVVIQKVQFYLRATNLLEFFYRFRQKFVFNLIFFDFAIQIIVKIFYCTFFKVLITKIFHQPIKPCGVEISRARLK